MHSFTPREASVLQLVAEGLMNKEIARQLETSIRNVEKYVSRLFNKTGTSSRTELVRYALEHRLVTDAGLPPGWREAARTDGSIATGCRVLMLEPW